jgi:hypothetical protein
MLSVWERLVKVLHRHFEAEAPLQGQGRVMFHPLTGFPDLLGQHWFVDRHQHIVEVEQLNVWPV